MNMFADQDKRVEFNFKKNSKTSVFFVRFYDKEDEKEFRNIMKFFSKKEISNVSFEERNGTYKVESLYPVGEDAVDSWTILMHKYMNLSHEIRKDVFKNERYYAVRFSDTFIPPIGKRLIASY